MATTSPGPGPTGPKKPLLPLRQCRLPGCPTHFRPDPQHRNKEFCSPAHRLRFHSEQRKAAMALLLQQQGDPSQ